MLENLKQELLAKKEQIDGSEDKNTGGFYCLHYNVNAVYIVRVIMIYSVLE